jgi:hypothetical protein
MATHLNDYAQAALVARATYWALVVEHAPARHMCQQWITSDVRAWHQEVTQALRPNQDLDWVVQDFYTLANEDARELFDQLTPSKTSLPALSQSQTGAVTATAARVLMAWYEFVLGLSRAYEKS